LQAEIDLIAALSRFLKPLVFSSFDSTTEPSGPTRKDIDTVPCSSFISDAFGYSALQVGSIEGGRHFGRGDRAGQAP
jgi:hypothetical protein